MVTHEENSGARTPGNLVPSPGDMGKSALGDPRKKQEVLQVLMSLSDDVTPKEQPPDQDGHPLGCAALFMAFALLGPIALVGGYKAAADAGDVDDLPFGIVIPAVAFLVCLVCALLYVTVKSCAAYRRRDYRAAIGSTVMSWGAVLLLVALAWYASSRREDKADHRPGAAITGPVVK